MTRFAGKAIYLTGAGSGIGRATARLFASEGAAVTGLDVDETALAETAEFIEAEGGTFHSITGDLRERQICIDAVAEAADTMGGIDVVANIAGVVRGEHFVDVPEQAWQTMCGVNLDAVIYTAQAAIPKLLERNGVLINISSNAGYMGQAYTALYCATKFAVSGLTKALAMEYIKQPIRINAVAPGGTQTSMTDTFQIPADVDFDLMARYTSPRGMMPPESLAEVIAFVASDAASAMHGAIVPADAGITAG